MRRPTGGQAVLHDRELTYAVALGREHLEPFSKREIYQFIAGLLLAGLEALGIRAQSSRAALGSPHNPDCFRSTGQYEIADERHRKLIGSAQVVTRRFSLQHGAIPLDGSYRRIAGYLAARAGFRRAAPGRSTACPPPSARSWAGRWATRRRRRPWPAARATRWSAWASPCAPGSSRSEERERAAALLDSKYSRDEWNLQY